MSHSEVPRVGQPGMSLREINAILKKARPLPNHFLCVIGRTIIDDQKFEIFNRLSLKCSQSMRKEPCIVVAADDDGKIHDGLLFKVDINSRALLKSLCL